MTPPRYIVSVVHSSSGESAMIGPFRTEDRAVDYQAYMDRALARAGIDPDEAFTVIGYLTSQRVGAAEVLDWLAD